MEPYFHIPYTPSWLGARAPRGGNSAVAVRSAGFPNIDPRFVGHTRTQILLPNVHKLRTTIDYIFSQIKHSQVLF